MTIHCIPPILSDKYQRTKAFYPNLKKKGNNSGVYPTIRMSVY